MAASTANSANPGWGDYDNDGDLDLALTKISAGAILLRNDSTSFSYGPALPSTVTSSAVTWFDYDNDGLLDLFYHPGVLLRNNGDGTFTSVANVLGGSDYHCTACGDFDNDGFMDLFATSLTGQNGLFRNLGNTNHWIKIRLIGSASNRDAFGAKVRVLASIRGQNIWQMREISSGAYCQDDPRPNFGLGDATKVDEVRIEWPSGIVQTMTNMTPGQILPVFEHQEYNGPAPAFAGLTKATNGMQISINEPTLGTVYFLEGSTNLMNWTKLTACRSAGGTLTYTDTAASGCFSRFYRVVVP
jgi:hypothetical protein